MAYLKFLDSSNVLRCMVAPVSGNVVELSFTDSIVVDTSGFRLYIDKACTLDIAGSSYEGYRTIYRNDEYTASKNGYQLSNDGSVYVAPEPVPEPEPEPFEPYVPTLEEMQEMKVSEMNATQQNVIQAGLDITLSDGTVEHFTLTDHDQTSLMGLQTRVIAGDEMIPWHTSDQTEHCKYYSNTDMAIITSQAMAFVTYHVTYFRDLRIYIRSLPTEEEVGAVYYGMPIPEEFQSQPLKDMTATGLVWLS